MAKAEKKEVAEVQQPQAPAVQDPDASWGSENVDSKDLLVPKILVMQGLSQLVADGSANVGQIRESLGGTLLGGKEKPVELIAFSSFRTWVCFEKINDKDEYTGTMPITPENEGLPINEIVNGLEVRRDKCLNFYVLVADEVKSGMAFPYVVSFRRTSAQAGKKLSTFAAKFKAFGKPMACKTMMLKAVPIENDKGKFFGFDIELGRDTSPEELKEARKWYDAFKTSNVKVDDSDMKQPPGAAHVQSAPTTQEY